MVSRGRGAAVVVLAELPAQPADRTYQLWLLQGSDALSAGTVDMAEPHRVTRVLRAGVTAADGLGLTVEPSGGSPAPTPPVIAQIPFG